MAPSPSLKNQKHDICLNARRLIFQHHTRVSCILDRDWLQADLDECENRLCTDIILQREAPTSTWSNRTCFWDVENVSSEPQKTSHRRINLMCWSRPFNLVWEVVTFKSLQYLVLLWVVLCFFTHTSCHFLCPRFSFVLSVMIFLRVDEQVDRKLPALL